MCDRWRFTSPICSGRISVFDVLVCLKGLFLSLQHTSATRLSKILDVVHSRGGAAWAAGDWFCGFIDCK